MPRESYKKKYWKKNLQYLTVLLGIWFIVSYVFSILLVDLLDKVRFFGFKLGYGTIIKGAKQGSIGNWSYTCRTLVLYG